MFKKLYDWTMKMAEHPKAAWWLGGVSFAESSFFPIPVDIMLMPMVLRHPERAWLFAAIAVTFSVLGAIGGYLIGYYFFEAIEPWLRESSKWEYFEGARGFLDKWGFWAALVASITPFPYKVYTIASGWAGAALLPFIIGSVIGRSVRFFLVAGVTKVAGPAAEKHLLKHIDLAGWVCLGLIGLYIAYKVIA